MPDHAAAESHLERGGVAVIDGAMADDERTREKWNDAGWVPFLKIVYVRWLSDRPLDIR
jgi:hypothetical protein